MDWFRMYSEFAHDAKVQSMSEAMQRRLMMLFCLRCSNALVTLHDDEICFALRISNEDLFETKALFLRKGFISDAWEILNWDKRQFHSDSSAARVARHRASKKEAEKEAEKEPVTLCNVTVTPQNRTEQNRTEDMSGKPVGVEVEILEYLNLKTKKEFRQVKANLSLITARLREGATPEEIKSVIDVKTKAWSSDEKMQEYLRPETLFGARKFAGYVAELTVKKAIVDSKFAGAK